MLDKDMVNIISHLYFNGRIADARTRAVLHCHQDTVEPLEGSGVVNIVNGDWTLAPGVLGFLKLAEASLRSFPPRDWIFRAPLRDPLAQPLEKPWCFLAMPYGPPWFAEVRDAIRRTAGAAGYDFDIAADVSRPGDIVHQVWTSIRRAEVTIADLTGLNPNVMYEVGIAHAIGKEVILITQAPGTLPFDIRGKRWHGYRLAAMSDLDASLHQSLEEVARELAIP
jgi:hypothetical protein